VTRTVQGFGHPTFSRYTSNKERHPFIRFRRSDNSTMMLSTRSIPKQSRRLRAASCLTAAFLLGSLLLLPYTTCRAQTIQQVVGLNLIAAGTSNVVANLFDGAVVTLPPSVTTTNFGMEVIVSPPGSTGMSGVQFDFNGVSPHKFEYMAPYALCGNVGPSFNACPTLVIGFHTVTAKVIGTASPSPHTLYSAL
jgi:hypothetical protein